MTVRRQKEFTGTHMVLLICGFFGTIIAVNLVLTWFAIGTWTGLVVDNSYVASQEFNSKLEAARKQESLGWSSDIDYTGGAVEFRLNDNNGAALAGAGVTVKLGRPSNENSDRTVRLAETGSGVYTASIALDPGPWELDITANYSQDRHYRQIFRIMLREGSDGTLRQTR